MSSKYSQLLNLLEDHVELAQLEYRYESFEGRRRLFGLIAAVLCLTSSFVFIQISVTYLLLRLGIPLFVACAGLAVVWGVAGVIVFKKYGHRNPQAGEPFEGTLMELRKSLQWIPKIFS